MSDCCGAERKTPFCPICGRKLYGGEHFKLLAHVQTQVRHAKEAIAHGEREEFSAHSMRHRRRALEKWEPWQRFVERAIAAGITGDAEEEPT